jgi:hypothetical protein
MGPRLSERLELNRDSSAARSFHIEWEGADAHKVVIDEVEN